MQEHLDDLRVAGIQVVAISYDSTETLKEFAERARIQFPLLSDMGSRTIDAYGVRNRDVESGSPQDGIPHPGTVVIDENGKIIAKLFHSIRKRHTPDELLQAVKAASVP